LVRAELPIRVTLDRVVVQERVAPHLPSRICRLHALSAWGSYYIQKELRLP